MGKHKGLCTFNICYYVISLHVYLRLTSFGLNINLEELQVLLMLMIQFLHSTVKWKSLTWENLNSNKNRQFSSRRISASPSIKLKPVYNTCWHCFALPPDCPAGSVTLFQPLSCSGAGYSHLIALGFWKQVANPLEINYFPSRCQTVLWSLIQTPTDILKNCSSFPLMETSICKHFSPKLKINRKLTKNTKRHPVLVQTSTKSF